MQYGAQANEHAIRSQLQSIAVFAAFTTSPTGTNSAAQISALSQRIATNLTPQPGQQTIEDIQSDFAAAQTVMKDATARQTQSQTMLQNMVDSTETVSTRSGRQRNPGAADRAAGVLPDHLDAVATDPDQVSAGRLVRAVVRA